MKKGLSILIPSLPKRESLLKLLFDELIKQGNALGKDNHVYINIDCDTSISIGEKRNLLLNSKPFYEYVAFIDDDDMIAPNYLSLIFEGINKGVDCCSLKGTMTTNGENPETFEHSLKYNKWATNSEDAVIKYERTINHLNCIRGDIARRFAFPETNFGEDHAWSNELHKSGLLKTEHYIDEVIYFYRYRTNK